MYPGGLAGVPLQDMVLAASVVLAGYVVLGASGFGSALTIVPILAWRWPLTLVVPLVLLLDTPASLLHARLNAKRVVWREFLDLLPGMVAGAALGAWLARWTSQPWALMLLATYIIGVGLRGLLRAPAPSAASSRRWSPVAGVAVGVVESSFGTAGPLIVAWLSRRLHDPQNLRSTTPVAIVAASFSALLSMTASGQMAQPLLWTALPVLLVLALAGLYIGHRVALSLPGAWLQRGIYALLVASGAAMLMRSLLPS